MPPQKAHIQTVVRQGQQIDVTVASEELQPGDMALRIPERLVVTLDRIFEDGAVAELLTTNKLSELACLSLYLSYEKKRGSESFWAAYIKELGNQQARGPQGAKSPLLWPEHQVQELLQGSPIIGQINERLQGIRKEYEELDTVWFMAGSLFKHYPYEIPTEQFSLDVFKQAFVAIQASVVHLQGVPVSKRFALVPLGPPLLNYSSTAKAMLQYDAKSQEVQLVVDRAYQPGDPLVAWCGPQPNSRLFINYGIVDEDNPYDKLPLSVTIPSADPLYRQKRDKLAAHSLSTQQTFQLQRNQDLPSDLLPYMRLVAAEDLQQLEAVEFGEEAVPLSPANERVVLSQLIGRLRERLSRYGTTVEQDDAVIADPTSRARAVLSARLVRIEKIILQQALDTLLRLPGGEEASHHAPPATGLKLD